MENFSELFQTADWSSEKHVPVIEGPIVIRKGEMNKYTVSIGKEIAHPNTTEHHIMWLAVYFHPDGDKFPYEIGKVDFSAHGASVKGPDTSTVYTHHAAALSFKTDKPGTLHATSSCNIHGLWKNSLYIRVE